MKYDVILLVAGAGKRMQKACNKVLLELEGRPVFAYSLSCFLADEDCRQIILVGRAKEYEAYRSYLSDRVCFVTGGKERQDSVRLGLIQVRSPYVMVHDGARPFISLEQLQALKRKPNSILAVPVKDTIKQVSGRKVEKTLPRDRLYQVQTPQFFESVLLQTVHKKAIKEGYQGTDDASLVERFSTQTVTIVSGSYANLKLTTPEDLLFAKSILKAQTNC